MKRRKTRKSISKYKKKKDKRKKISKQKKKDIKKKKKNMYLITKC